MPAMARFWPAPIPVASTSGIMPATKASVVIRMGRSRSLVRLEDGLESRHALRSQVVRVIDLQDRVLLHDAEEHEQAEAPRSC